MTRTDDTSVGVAGQLLDRTKKLAIYAREGVRHMWFLDALQKSLEVLRLEGVRWSLTATYEGERRIRPEPFDAIELDLDSVWGERLTAP